MPLRTETQSEAAARKAEPSKSELVLAAAERCFLARGFGAVSMDAIAREAGVSKATVYAHFADKAALFGAVIARLNQRFGGFSADALDPAAAEASLTTLARRLLELVLSPEAIALNRIIIAEVTRFPELGEAFWQAGPERTRAQIEAFLRRATAAGTLAVAEPRRAAEQFAALARGEIHLRQMLRPEGEVGPKAIAAAAASSVQVFLKAFGPRG
jgi:TetR/AcrR family transcriptional regulator, mexJK operon transcriptional repressor